MALTNISNEIGNDPDSLKALYKTFTDVEEIPFAGLESASLYKTFRIQGQGVPRSDNTYVRLLFERTIKGVCFVAGWNYADPDSNL